jgi:phage shock protein A
MGIFSKIKTVVSSNINDMISKAEKPEKMLNQLLIDMNDNLIKTKQAVAMAIADEKKLEREKDNQQAQSQQWEKKAMLAVQAGRDDLAKEALIRKQEYDNAYLEYQKQWADQKTAVDKLKENLRELQNKIDEAQRKKNLLIARAKRAEAQQKIQETISSVSGNRSAFDTFDRMAAKVDQMEAQAEAYKELTNLSENADLEKKFKELEKSDTSTDVMLAELKEKMKSLPEKSS